MAIKDDFLEEIQIGDYVEITYGLQNEITVRGFVRKLSNGSVRLETDSGTPRINLDHLVTFDTPPAPAENKTEASTLISAKKEEDNASEGSARSEKTTELLKNSKPMAVEKVADLKALKDRFFDIYGENRKYANACRTVQSITDTFMDFKNRTSIAQLRTGDQLHNLRAKALRLMADFPELSDDVNVLLASIFFQAEDYGQAEKYYAQAEDSFGAAYAALLGSNYKNLDTYLDGYIMAPDIADPYLYFQYAKSAGARKSVKAICACLNNLEQTPVLDEDLDTELKLLSECALILSEDAHITPFWYVRGEAKDVLHSLKEFINALPGEWTKTSVPISICDIPAPETFTSYIVDFDGANRTGYIKDTPFDRFFHITNVCKEDELRRALQKQCAKNLEVTYNLGKSYRQGMRPSAYNIRLTERGQAEAKKRLSKINNSAQTVETGERCCGDVIQYTDVDEFGRIYCGGTEFNFKTNAIMDIRLLAHLKISFSPDVRVSFFTQRHKDGKIVAVNIVLAEDAVCDVTEDEISDLIRSGVIKSADVERCAKAKASKAVSVDKDAGVSGNEETDYYDLDYNTLDPILPEPVSELSETAKTEEGSLEPEKKNVSAVVESFNPPAPSTAMQEQKLPALEPIERNSVNIFSNLKPINGYYYDQAHQKMILGDIKGAEELYIKALCARDHVDSAVADLASVYMRDVDRFKDALDLMDVYGSYLPSDKRLNILIQIFQKKKERASRIKLCYLYEEALSGNLQTKTKFHYLLALGDVLCNMGEYAQALVTCRRVHQLYDTEVQYGGPAAVTQYGSRLNLVRRLEATCSYFLGDRERARKLAQEMLNVSNADTRALQIMEGTLTEGSGAIIPEDSWRNESSAMVTDFANARVDEVSLSRYLRGVEEQGVYTGNPQKASEDIKKLLDARGKTPFYRSESLMCAAKIVRSIRQRFDEKGADQAGAKLLPQYQLTPKSERIYIGRSMASYGDYILEQQKNKDTARYSYLQALDMLEEHETDWQMALYYYVASYFNAQVEMADIISKDYLSAGSRKSNYPQLKNQTLLNVGEFAVGLLRLRKCLGKIGNNKANNNIVNFIREGAVLEDLKLWLKGHMPETDWNHVDGPDHFLNEAERIMHNAETTLSEHLTGIPDQILSNAGSADICAKINDETLTCWLMSTDKRYVETFLRIIGDFRSYFSNPAFQYRSTVLNATIQSVTNLMKEIAENPTGWSYDTALPVLNRTRERLVGEQDSLYRSQPPEIEISLTEEMPPYLGTNSEVYVHLNISNGGALSNGAERQLADNIKLEVFPGVGVTFARFESEPGGFINGGESREEILVFQIQDESVLLFGSFDLKVNCRYRYNERFNEVREESVEFSDSIGFRRDQHVKIANPFRQHIGSEMRDESMFYGRDVLIAELIDSLTVDGKWNYGHGILLYGQTRAGKSSIRHHFAKRVRQSFPNAVLVDMENLNGSSLNETSFYCNLVKRIEDELKCDHSDIVGELAEIGAISPGTRMEEHPEHAGDIFRSYMKKVTNLLQKKNRMIILIADEFSSINVAINEKRMSIHFLQAWKAMLENYGFFAVCFGQDDTPQFVRKDENAFACMRQVKVTYLDETAAKKLIDEPIAIRDAEGNLISRFASSALDEIYHLTAGSAFLIIKVCSLLVDYLNVKSVSRVTPAILRNFLNTSVFEGNDCLTESDFEPQIGDRGDQSLKDINRALLLEIARKSRANGWAENSDLSLEGYDIVVDRPVKAYLGRLEERDVVEIKEGRRCRIKVNLLSMLLLLKYGKE